MATSAITVSGLQAAPGLDHVALQWTFSDPSANGLPYMGLDAVEVWAATTNDRSTSSKVAEGRGNALHPALTEGANYFYWVRARDNNSAPLYSAWSPSGSTSGVQCTVGVASINKSVSRYTLEGGQLVCSVSGGALTIAIKTLAGADPSIAAPVNVKFYNRVALAADEVRAFTAANSITIPSGATLGVVNNGLTHALTIYVCLVRDSASLAPRLAVMNCVEEQFTGSHVTDLVIYPISDLFVDGNSVLTTRAAIDTGSDSAGVLYYGGSTFATNDSFPVRIIGRINFDAGLSVAPGTWELQSSVELIGEFSKLPGAEIRRIEHNIRASQSMAFGGGGTTSFDKTADTAIPRTQGVNIATLTLATLARCRLWELEFEAMLTAPSTSEYLALSIGPAGATPGSDDAVASVIAKAPAADVLMPIRLRHLMKWDSDIMTYGAEFLVSYSGSGSVYLNMVPGGDVRGKTLVTSCRMIERQL